MMTIMMIMMMIGAASSSVTSHDVSWFVAQRERERGFE
jgi:hypothetical protein